MYTFKMPGTAMRELERLLSKFIWNCKMHVWSWQDICKPKSEGGVGIRKIKYMKLQV